MAQILTHIGNPLDVIRGTKHKGLISEKIQILLKETDEAVWPCMKQIISDHAKPILHEALLSAIANKDHLERAFFMRMGIEAYGGNWKSAVQALAGEEFAYSSLMVLDDVVDGTKIRMGQPTLHESLGTGKAVAIGEVLRSLASIGFSQCTLAMRLDAQTISKIWTYNAEMYADTYYSQWLDIDTESKNIIHVTDRMYLDLVKHSTAVDIANCLRIGALLSQVANESSIPALWEYGIKIGILMQFRDDLLDFISDENQIHKTPFVDIMSRKKRLPIIVAHQFSSEAEKKRIENLMGREDLSTDDKTFLQRIILREPITQYMSALALKFQANALLWLDRANLPTYYSVILKEIVNNVAILA